eukprot:scaffold75717_cov36-Phaeocystis_antarctica.AAC.2
MAPTWLSMVAPWHPPMTQPLLQVPEAHSAGWGQANDGAVPEEEGTKEHTEGAAIVASALGTVPDSRKLPWSSSFLDTSSVAISVGIVPEIALPERSRATSGRRCTSGHSYHRSRCRRGSSPRPALLAATAARKAIAEPHP